MILTKVILGICWAILETDTWEPLVELTRNDRAGCYISLKKRYKGVQFNAIRVTRGWVCVNFPGKKVLRNVHLNGPQRRGGWESVRIRVTNIMYGLT